MNTIDEMIAVIQAYKEGKTIEFYASTKEWRKCVNPVWDFENINYRIKPEPHYRPFKSAEEVMEALKEHGDWVKLIINDWRIRLVGYCNERVSLTGYHNIPLEEAFENVVFADGTPFGKLVEE